MANFSSLVRSLPFISHPRASGSGYGLWLTWQDQLSNSVVGTLQDYGAFCLCAERDQALWFSSNTDVFRALARLKISAQLLSIPVFIQVFPATFQIASDLSYSLAVPSEILKQSMESREELDIWIHPKHSEIVKRISGLRSHARANAAGLTNLGWMSLNVDENLEYEHTCSWFLVIKPVGRMRMKEAMMGWLAFREGIEDLIVKHNIENIVGTREELLLLNIAGYQALRAFCQDYLELCRDSKEEESRNYWPSVAAATPQHKIPFTEEAAGKFNINWEMLVPDIPHLQYRDAYILSEWFQIHEARAGSEETFDSWCNVTLKKTGILSTKAPADIFLPKNVLFGEKASCFYCGMRNHAAADCPSREYQNAPFKIWKELAREDVENFPRTIKNLDHALENKNIVSALRKMLIAGDDPEHKLLRAIYEINVPNQLRMLQLIWQVRGKEWPVGLEKIVETDGQFAREAFELLLDKKYIEAETELKKLRTLHPRSIVPVSLLGFLFMEVKDTARATFFWEETERLCSTPLLKGYFIYQRARITECLGSYREAASIYKLVSTISPAWPDPLYRSAVCLVKLGFTGQAVDILSKCIDQDPHCFNRILIDPELDRGRTHILSALWEHWHQIEATIVGKREEVENLKAEITVRFDEEHKFFIFAQKHLGYMQKLGQRSNYVAFRELITRIARFKERLESQVNYDVKVMRRQISLLFGQLKEIQQEASWFPYPKMLREFNRDFNYCVEKMNWVLRNPIKGQDNFREARQFVRGIQDHLKALRRRLATLRIIRDTTLFALMLGRSFIWLEVAGLGLALVGIPSILYFTRNLEGIWILDIIREREWEFQKALILILSGSALLVAAFKSAIVFEKRRRELFSQKQKE